jgi:hypothetical protein
MCGHAAAVTMLEPKMDTVSRAKDRKRFMWILLISVRIEGLSELRARA